MSEFFETDQINTKIQSIQETNQKNHIWVEKYRPIGLDNFIGNDTIKRKVQEFIDEQDFTNMIFYGSPGTGKTTIAKIIVNNINCDLKYINASDKNSVDDVRNEIKEFSMGVGINKLKVVILDECLDENTLVSILRNGQEIKIPIKNLNSTTDLVKSYNIEKSEIQWRPFDLHDIGDADVYEIEFENNEKIICTDTHKWYVEDKNGNIIEIKVKDLISEKYDYILSP